MTDYQPMTEPEQRDYAEALILEQARKVEGWDIVFHVGRLTDRKTVLDETDTQAVLNLVKKASVTVHFD